MCCATLNNITGNFVQNYSSCIPNNFEKTTITRINNVIRLIWPSNSSKLLHKGKFVPEMNKTVNNH